MQHVLDIRSLHVTFHTGGGDIPAVRGVNLHVAKGECLGVVGESGSGKSVTFLSVLRLLGPTGKIETGQVDFLGRDLTRMKPAQLRQVRGGRIAMVFQDPMSSLNPLLPVGDQVGEMLWAHDKRLSKADRDARVLELLRMVRIPEAEKRLRGYPHEFSGGMRQRVMIAMALACKPDLLIADEPTTALDVSIQHQILKLLRALQAEMGTGIVFITHDLGVIAQLCSRVIVMYGGLVMEEAPIAELFASPLHPYTQGLLASIPSIRQDKARRLCPIPGSPPDMSRPPAGCPFAPRCPHVRVICTERQAPCLVFSGGARRCACWLHSPDAPADDNPFYGLAQGGERP
ncbi:MAG: ABC transporter ATP-binding protein [Oscillospiraceae bacterium]|jgi:oligopeptide transport system ATP-binding protein|nr:ABC transporter ATP-binding protein [Oscillospiraceae bacterium]